MVKSELNEIIKFEQKQYNDYIMPTKKKRFFSWLKRDYPFLISKWQRISRITDYHKKQKSILSKFWYLVYTRKKNILSQQLGIEMGTANVGKGLMVYHSNGIVVNGNAIIGKNCHFHGNNCIGNSGYSEGLAPTIGDNVMIGVGAKVIGNVFIADNIKIAAGAVVVHSFETPGITIAGVPARRVR